MEVTSPSRVHLSVVIVAVLLSAVVLTTVWMFQTKRAESERANQKANQKANDILMAQLLKDLQLAREELTKKEDLYSDYEKGLIQIKQIKVRYANIYGNAMKSVYVANHTDRAISKIVGYWDMGWRAQMIMGTPTRLRMKRECVFNQSIEVGGEICVGETPWTDTGTIYGRLRITDAVNDRDSKTSPPFNEEEIWELKKKKKALEKKIGSLAKNAPIARSAGK